MHECVRATHSHWSTHTYRPTAFEYKSGLVSHIISARSISRVPLNVRRPWM